MSSLALRLAVAGGAVLLLLSQAGVASAAGAAPAKTRPDAGGAGHWGKAEQIPGLAAINHGSASIHTISCASAGNCSAGGQYDSTGFSGQAFVVSQVRGRWGKAEEVPGTARLNKGGDASVTSVSCASAGNCTAGGFYVDSADFGQAFVVTEVRGRWGKAEEVPGTAALNKGPSASVTSVSCASAGNCTIGGTYRDASDDNQVFVASEVRGRWGKAEEIPGTATLNKGGDASVTSVSCASAGNCTAGGSYAVSNDGDNQAFVVSQIRGHWRNAVEARGTGALNTGNNATVNSVSCASAGNCSAGGWYTDSGLEYEAFVVSQVRGTWKQAEEVPGTATLNYAGNARITSVSCASPGNCSAVGTYDDPSVHLQVFVASEVRGTWKQAEEVPGTATLNTGDAAINSVSCASAGNCSAGGSYTDSSDHAQAFVVSEVRGRWGKAEEVPGTDALNVGGDAVLTSVSCAGAGNCTAAGTYAGSDADEPFVVSETLR